MNTTAAVGTAGEQPAEPWMIFHIAFRADWEAVADSGWYEVSTRGVTLAEQGFVHCSRRHQVLTVAEAVYADVQDELVLLTVDPTLLDAPVRYEPVEPGGEEFPHVYGPVPEHAVVAVHPLVRGADGRFELPAG